MWNNRFGRVLLISVMVTPFLAACPVSAGLLGASLIQLGDQVNEAIHHAGVDANVAVVRAGAELNKAIENARNAWEAELGKSLDRVDESIYSAYRNLEQLTKDLTLSADAMVQEVGDRAQIAANTLPFAERSPQIREHSEFFVVGAIRHKVGEPELAQATTTRWASATLSAPAVSRGWSIDPKSAAIVVDEQSTGIFSTRWQRREATGLVAIITAEQMWDTSIPASMKAHLEWTEVRDPGSVEVSFEGNFFDVGKMAEQPTLSVGGFTYPASDAIQTRLEFLVPETAFGDPSYVLTPRPITLQVPYRSGFLKRTRIAQYALTLRNCQFSRALQTSTCGLTRRL